MASFSAMLHSSAKQNGLFCFRMAGGYTRKLHCHSSRSKKAHMPGSMSEFPTQDIFRQETGPFDEYNTIAISKMPLIGWRYFSATVDLQ